MKSLHAPVSLIILVLGISFYSCGGNYVKSFQLNGHFREIPEDATIILSWFDGTAHSDTLPGNRESSLQGTLEYPTLATLTVKLPGNERKYSFYLDHALIEMNIPASFDTIAISGSVENEKYDLLKSRLKQIQPRIDTLQKSYDAGVAQWNMLRKGAAPQVKLDSLLQLLHKYEDRIDSLEISKGPVYEKFIHDFPDSYVSGYALTSWQGMYINPREARPAYESLNAGIKDCPEIQRWEEALRFFEETEPGKPAPTFTEPDLQGNPVHLSDYRGKNVLVLFWASWCRPCREENRELVPVYEQYQGKNIEFISIAMDDSREDWEKAIRMDRLSWVTLCDFRLKEGEAAAKYIWNTRNQAYTLPQNVLVDPRGIIMGRNLTLEEIRAFLVTL